MATHTTDKLLIVLPNWVGDVVMATPMLRATRNFFYDSTITVLGRPLMRELLEGLPWIDDFLPWDRSRSMSHTAALIRQGKFDTAVILPNSPRSALLVAQAGVPRRIGYATQARQLLLTDRINPPTPTGSLRFVPAITWYLQLLAGFCDADISDHTMTLAVTDHQKQHLFSQAERWKLDLQQPFIVLNPGASFGPSKCYPPDYYATVADTLAERHHTQTVLVGSPADRPAMHAVADHMHTAAIIPGNDAGLATTKALLAYSKLLITNDTGTRHIAAAMSCPLVTIFGSTDPDRTVIDYKREIICRVSLYCSPCQQKTCPLFHHHCMHWLDPDTVTRAAEQMLTEPDNPDISTDNDCSSSQASS